MIFETSGQPAPTEEEVQFEAQEIVQRSGWGLPLIERLKKIADPYWREAIARNLLELWRELVRDKDEQWTDICAIAGQMPSTISDVSSAVAPPSRSKQNKHCRPRPHLYPSLP